MFLSFEAENRILENILGQGIKPTDFLLELLDGPPGESKVSQTMAG